ncbi:MAG: multicopper oxidase domain-containing protein, partial [Acidimicrobiia bacterium]|nr:multicopper oxidase domain-containing protein [Acidimicrobiia bacterium]
MERRSFLKHSLSSLAALTSLPLLRTATAESLLTKISGIPSKLATTVEISLRATRRRVKILPGSKTAVWSFKGRVLEGGKGRLEPVPGSYLGPTLRFHQGDRVTMAFKNRLPEESVVHWHGLHVPEAADGHPRLAIPQGKTYRSTFDVLNRAGTYWYHPHPHGRTGPQVYRGLAGLIIVSDDNEQALDLPRGDYDVPLVLQDRTFGSNNQILYDQFPMHGFLGETILVNGKPDYVLDVDSRPYRLRLLNGSNS